LAKIKTAKAVRKKLAAKKYHVIKLLRAVGGCLGIDRRRRTCKPAKSFGEPEKA
jgi:hypothetical protein